MSESSLVYNRCFMTPSTVPDFTVPTLVAKDSTLVSGLLPSPVPSESPQSAPTPTFLVQPQVQHIGKLSISSTPALTSARNSQTSTDSLGYLSHQTPAVSTSLTIQDEEPTQQIKQQQIENPKETDPKAFINIALTYKARKQRLVIAIHSLTCSAPAPGRNTKSFLIGLTLNRGKQHHIVGVPSLVDSGSSIPPLKTAVFKGLVSNSLASQSLTVKVYPTTLIRKSGQLLFQACIPLSAVSLTGDADWVSLKPTHTDKKTESSISVCMCYHIQKKKLMVTVVNAKSLKKWPIRNDSYVEVKLFRGVGKNSTMQTVCTKSHNGGRNPVYKEAFLLDFPSTGPKTNDGNSSNYTEVTFTVRRKRLLRTDKVLGQVTLSSNMCLRWKRSELLKNTLDEIFRHPGKVITQSHTLSNCS